MKEKGMGKDGGDKVGSTSAFDQNWRTRRETKYNHWVKGRPANQIQLAFRSHWHLFSGLIGEVKTGRCLEVGCGRGSISSYFADNRFRCTLLDSSVNVLDIAKEIFRANNHKAEFVHGDALDMPFEDYSFDVVVSIGLLEHFEEIRTPIAEQIRVLKSGGLFLGYIVPERRDNIQRYFRWVNAILKAVSRLAGSGASKEEKTQIFRSDYASPSYVEALAAQQVRDLQVLGVYPLPMVSHSSEFPFSLLPAPLELVLTRIFEISLLVRRALYSRNPWVCEEKIGQAFLVACRKR